MSKKATAKIIPVQNYDGIALSVFDSRLRAICEEMGAVLRRAAFSPNIRDRLDYSCAIFDATGQLLSQAAHIPVHLGSMAYAMADVVQAQSWRCGDVLLLNDPFLGGTHLPDVTAIAPVFAGHELQGFVANRAHHADIGTQSPGSMPLSRSLAEEGVVIAPTLVRRAGEELSALQHIVAQMNDQQGAQGDFSAQISSVQTGVQRLQQLIANCSPGTGAAAWQAQHQALNIYGQQLAEQALQGLAVGKYSFCDYLDDDGQGNEDIAIQVSLTVTAGHIHADFTGSSAQVAGNLNCPLAVTAAAVIYAVRCLLPAHAPACAGTFSVVSVSAPIGSLLNAQRPAAVTAGNVETSTRVVDVMLGALAQALPERIPAASHGSMNNLAMGWHGDSITDTGQMVSHWDYYETMGGGMGGGASAAGAHAVQTHMTNTLNTPIEVLESNYPVRVQRYQRRHGSGGAGQHMGGDGLIREYEFLAPAEVTLLTERRRLQPWGLMGGQPGQAGINQLNGQSLSGKCQLRVKSGDRLQIATAGGGGWGTKS